MSERERNNEHGPIVADVGIADKLGLYYLAQLTRQAGVTLYPFDNSTEVARLEAAKLFAAANCRPDEDPMHYMDMAFGAMERGSFVVGLVGYSDDPRMCGHFAIDGVQKTVQQLVARVN
jgi:hypothetical protein